MLIVCRTGVARSREKGGLLDSFFPSSKSDEFWIFEIIFVAVLIFGTKGYVYNTLNYLS